jgi:hypothetical protein
MIRAATKRFAFPAADILWPREFLGVPSLRVFLEYLMEFATVAVQETSLRGTRGDPTKLLDKGEADIESTQDEDAA